MKFSKLSASAEYNMFVLKGKRCMDGRWSVSHTCIGGAEGQMLFKKSTSLSWLTCTCTDGLSAPFSLHWWPSPPVCPHLWPTPMSGHPPYLWGFTSAAPTAAPMGARVSTDPLLTLTPGSALLPWNFVGANSNSLWLAWLKYKIKSEQGRLFLQPLCVLLFCPAITGSILLQLHRQNCYVVCCKLDYHAASLLARAVRSVAGSPAQKCPVQAVPISSHGSRLHLRNREGLIRCRVDSTLRWEQWCPRDTSISPVAAKQTRKEYLKWPG